KKMKVVCDRDATTAAAFLVGQAFPLAGMLDASHRDGATKFSGVARPGANRPCAVHRRRQRLTNRGSRARFCVLLLWQKRGHPFPRDECAQIAPGCAPHVRSGEFHLPIARPTFLGLPTCASSLARSRQSRQSVSLLRERKPFHALLSVPRPAFRLLNCAPYPNPNTRETNDNNVACAPLSHSAAGLRSFHLRRPGRWDHGRDRLVLRPR